MAKLKKKGKIDERKVLRVPSNDDFMQPTPNQPEFDEFNDMGGEPNDFNMPQDVQQNTFNGLPDDGGFDAGVEASEEEDPKKYIQQLTGKLSQSLRSYNNELPSPDVDLNKYVSGMIVKQAIDGLSKEDVDDILSKIKSDETEQPIDDQQQEPPSQEGGEEQPMEEESVLRDSKDEEDIPYRKKPFSAPSFK